MLKAMSDYLARQQTIAVTVDTGVEIITSGLEKHQFHDAEVAEPPQDETGGWLFPGRVGL